MRAPGSVAGREARRGKPDAVRCGAARGPTPAPAGELEGAGARTGAVQSSAATLDESCFLARADRNACADRNRIGVWAFVLQVTGTGPGQAAPEHVQGAGGDGNSRTGEEGPEWTDG